MSTCPTERRLRGFARSLLRAFDAADKYAQKKLGVRVAYDLYSSQLSRGASAVRDSRGMLALVHDSCISNSVHLLAALLGAPPDAEDPVATALAINAEAPAPHATRDDDDGDSASPGQKSTSSRGLFGNEDDDENEEDEEDAEKESVANDKDKNKDGGGSSVNISCDSTAASGREHTVARGDQEQSSSTSVPPSSNPPMSDASPAKSSQILPSSSPRKHVVTAEQLDGAMRTIIAKFTDVSTSYSRDSVGGTWVADYRPDWRTRHLVWDVVKSLGRIAPPEDVALGFKHLKKAVFTAMFDGDYLREQRKRAGFRATLLRHIPHPYQWDANLSWIGVSIDEEHLRLSLVFVFGLALMLCFSPLMLFCPVRILEIKHLILSFFAPRYVVCLCFKLPFSPLV
jgi:hypothetical protein